MSSRTSRSAVGRSVISVVLGAAVVVGASACGGIGERVGADADAVSTGLTGVAGLPGTVRDPQDPPADPASPPEVPPAAERPDPGAPVEPAPPASPAPEGDPVVTAARAALGGLEIKGRAPKTGYDRDLFGQAWTDDVNVEFGHNGCDTRNDILRRDLTDITVKPGTRDCVVLTGVLEGPYTGERIEFQRGQATSSLVQIDHVVALSDAWQKGAQQLTEEQRRDLANDPLNLQAVSGWANQQKRDGDAATWLPPRREFRCHYVSRQVLVKERYGLWVTQAEKDAIDRVLASC